jgi:hypothetical protein
MALVSPGIQISINDQSQYVSNAVGSVPLVILATAQDKTYNGAIASGTTKANAGKLQSFTSQRDLVAAFGTPKFPLGASGSPVHAGELNEYGLMTAYSALGLGNQLYAIRADVDLAQLTGTSVRPSNVPSADLYWLDTVNTEWGIYTLSSTGSFDHITPTVITNKNQVEDFEGSLNRPMPKSSVGTMGSYAIAAVRSDGKTPPALRLWYKTTPNVVATVGSNSWVQVNSPEWQLATPAVIGTRVPSSIASGTTFTLNGQPVTISGVTPTVGSVASDINGTGGLTGVKAAAVGGKLMLFCTSSATTHNGTPAVHVQNGDCILNTVFGIPADGDTVDNKTFAGYYYCPTLTYGNYAERPDWQITDTTPRPSGSIWWKLGSTGQGLNISVKKYNLSTGQFVPQSVPAYLDFSAAVYDLDPIGGGVNIVHGQLVATYTSGVSYDGTYNALRLSQQRANTAKEINGETTASGGTPATEITGSFLISATKPGQYPNDNAVTISLSGTTAEDFVTDILAANIPYVTAAIENGVITITHLTGGEVFLKETSGTPLADAGFATDANGHPTMGSGYIQNPINGVFSLGKFDSFLNDGSISINDSAPYGAPATGTYWYYSNAADVDIMINNNGWKGYQRVSSDVRGYNLQNTDEMGVIISATQPTTQTNASSLVGGDLWLDSSDLENYPALYRYNDKTLQWTAINKADHTSGAGIIFADARWDGNSDDTGGDMNPITDDLPSTVDLLMSNYTDLDAPDYRLYPRGTLLFNTRRSGYNVKRFVSNYFNETAFPDADMYPDVTDAWVSASGNNTDGSMKAGTAAQRAIVVSALSSAIDSNLEVREDLYQFNLLVAPGYPELIDNLVTLNTDRGETGFVIGDTPMTLAATATALSNWNSNTSGNGLATASPYLGVYYPSGVTTDLSGNTVAVPPSYAVLRTFLYNDNVSHPWFAPAGTHRGLVSNIQDVGYVNANTGAWVHNSINQGLRDSLYTLKINPITQLPGVGIVVWGQETKSGTATSRNRINVVRLENYLRTIFKSIANGYLFEPNDQVTRKSISTQIESSLNDILSKRGLYDFLVVCDSTNNTSSTIANNQLYVDVAIEPARDVEFIYIPIALYNPGALAALGTSST